MPVTREGMERAMRVQEVIVRGLSGALTWLQVADILGRSPRSIRRMRWRFEQYGYDGLYDGRRAKPSPKRAPVAEVERILRLYRERYPGFNGRHFYQVARREHAVTLSYTFVKTLLQRAGLLASGRARGRHRRRREPRPCFGELLHLDGSLHPWLALDPERKQTLITVVDDATTQLLYGQFAAGGESVVAVMTALRAVLERHGLPMALYTDRARWAAYTPTSGTNPDRSKLTQVGRALQRLGIEHILGYSPQARGRSERVNRTLQDRLVNELRVAEIRTPAGANRYLRERFLPAFNTEFARAPTDPTAAFVPLGRTDLDQILCHEEERVVALDNTVRLDGVVMQLVKQRGRRSCAGLRVLLRRHLDGRHSVWWGTRCLGQYASSGHPWPAATRPSTPPLRAAN
ncbi:MAG: ISNCY family transposase [Candidatus Rokuibacteriota bacterium]|nr:MAG: ISNCY family transposase [Candidatus Rokubacteria bacterium]